MRFEPCLTEAESRALIEDIDRWCRRTGTNYNKLIVAARAAPSLRSMVRHKGRRISIKVARRVRDAMQENPVGIPRDVHKRRVAEARARPVRLSAVEIEQRRVDRSPCPKCGVRADIGCRHTQRWIVSAVGIGGISRI